MNEIEKQILKNQSRILSIISNLDIESLGETINRIDETQELLNPVEQQSIAERTHDALSQKTEVNKE